LFVTKFCPPSILYKYGPSPDVGVMIIDPSVEITEEAVVETMLTEVNSHAPT